MAFRSVFYVVLAAIITITLPVSKVSASEIYSYETVEIKNQRHVQARPYRGPATTNQEEPDNSTELQNIAPAAGEHIDSTATTINQETTIRRKKPVRVKSTLSYND